ncbi:hypothetical protein KY336_04750 [Candidatus Woesearchaeota archaeon]|nr:hypothetical protein [Candidatus Woesearchaeota archaeon]
MIGTKCRTLFGFEEKPYNSIDDIVGLKDYVNDLESDIEEYSSLRRFIPKIVKKDTDLLYNSAKKYICDYYKSVTVELKKIKKEFKKTFHEFRNLSRITSGVQDLREQLEDMISDYQRLNVVAKKKYRIRQIEKYIKKSQYLERLGIRQNSADFKNSSILENSLFIELISAGLVVSAVGISAVLLYKFFSF